MRQQKLATRKNSLKLQSPALNYDNKGRNLI